MVGHYRTQIGFFVNQNKKGLNLKGKLPKIRQKEGATKANQSDDDISIGKSPLNLTKIQSRISIAKNTPSQLNTSGNPDTKKTPGLNPKTPAPKTPGGTTNVPKTPGGTVLIPKTPGGTLLNL